MGRREFLQEVPEGAQNLWLVVMHCRCLCRRGRRSSTVVRMILLRIDNETLSQIELWCESEFPDRSFGEALRVSWRTQTPSDTEGRWRLKSFCREILELAQVECTCKLLEITSSYVETVALPTVLLEVGRIGSLVLPGRYLAEHLGRMCRVGSHGS
jgi:hypothetical protein